MHERPIPEERRTRKECEKRVTCVSLPVSSRPIAHDLNAHRSPYYFLLQEFWQKYEPPEYFTNRFALAATSIVSLGVAIYSAMHIRPH